MQKLRNLFRGRGGGHQKITLDYRGRGGGLGGPKKDYVIFELSLRSKIISVQLDHPVVYIYVWASSNCSNIP